MIYVGSKARFATDLVPLIGKARQPDQPIVMPFAGGCNLLQHFANPRIANDANPYLIAMWRALIDAKWVPPYVNAQQYTMVRKHPKLYPPALVGWVGFACSYRGKWWGGFAKKLRVKSGRVRDYQAESRRNIFKQLPKLQGVNFTSGPYHNLVIPPNAIVYCDPPYKATTQKYGTADFNYVKFWAWVRQISTKHQVYISEYQAPPDFDVVWQAANTTSLHKGKHKKAVEKLFVYKNSTY